MALFSQSSSRWGGFWERMVRTIKSHLRKMIGRARLTFAELETTLIEVERAINARPITYVTANEDGEPLPLTPSQLISGYRPALEGTDPPSEVLPQASSHDALVRRDAHRRALLGHWWTRWRQEYLEHVKRFHSPGQQTRSIRVGEMILIHDANQKRMAWPTAVVTEVIPGRDKLPRLAVLRTTSGILNGPIHRVAASD